MSESDLESFPRGHVAVYLDKAIVARLDALARHLSTPSRPITRSDALRALALLGLAVAEIDPEMLAPYRRGNPEG